VPLPGLQETTGIPARVEVVQVGDGQIPTAIEKALQYLPSSIQTVTVRVIVPRSLSKDAAEKYVANIRQQFQGNSQVKVQLIPSYIDVKATQKSIEIANSGIEAVASRATGKDEAATFMVNKNNETSEALRDWETSFGALDANESMVGSAVGVVRGSLSAIFWVTKIGLNPYGAALATLDFANEFVFARYGKSIYDTVGTTLPNEKGSLAIKIFNSTAWARMFVFGIARAMTNATAFGYIQHMSDPNRFKSPFESEFLGFASIKVLVDSFFGTLNTSALRTLWRKGYLSDAQRNFINWFGIGVIGQVGWLALLNQHYGIALGITILDYTIKASLWVASKVLPARRDVYVFHPALSEAEAEFMRKSAGLEKATDVGGRQVTMEDMEVAIKKAYENADTSGVEKVQRETARRVEAAADLFSHSTPEGKNYAKDTCSKAAALATRGILQGVPNSVSP
jgi:hypothetical protein